MKSLWDVLPSEIQQYIREISSAVLIQEIFKKNRLWYFLRIQSIRKLRPDYTGMPYRVGDRILIIQTNKLSYGTISSISYHHDYRYRVNLLNDKYLYLYNDRDRVCEDAVKHVVLLFRWKCCMCYLCKNQEPRIEGSICDYCLLNYNF